MRFKIPFVATALATSLLLLAACSSQKSSSSSSAGSNKSLIFAQSTKPVGMSPTMTNDTPSAQILGIVYNTLFVQKSNGKFSPSLALSYSNPDANTWKIKLRKGVKFQDGTPFNSAAVKYTFDKLEDPKTAAPRASLLKAITSIETPDDDTVVLHTAKPYGSMLADLSHSNASIISPTADKKQNLMTNPVGTGPYKFVKTSGDSIYFTRNDSYFGKKPKIKNVVFKDVPSPDTALSMLQTGQANLYYGVTSDSIKRVKGMKDVTFDSVKGTPQYFVVFNTNQGPAKDIKFRQAFAAAIDTSSMVKSMSGTAYATKGFIGPMVYGYKPSIEKSGPSFDLTKAKKAVKANGYDKVQINLMTTNTPTYQQTAQIVQQQLAAAGFDVKLQTYEYASFLTKDRSAQFDITLSSWSNLTMDGSENLYPNLDSDNIGISDQGNYKNPELDKLINESRTTVNKKDRLDYLNQANELIQKDLPVLPLFSSYVNVAESDGLTGVKIYPNGNFDITNAYFK